MRVPPRQTGFTLIELMITILIMALLTSAVTMSFSNTLKTSRRQDAIQQLQSFDAATRLVAKRYDKKVQEIFDLSASTLSRKENPGSETISAQVSLPSGITIDEIRIASQIKSDGEQATLDISPVGLSESYAVRLKGPGLDQWIVFAGMTGSMTEVPDEDTAITLIAGGIHNAR